MISDLLIDSCEELISCPIGKKKKEDLRPPFFILLNLCRPGAEKASFTIFKSIFHSDMVCLVLVTENNLLLLSKLV